MSAHLETHFPGLFRSRYRVTSPRTAQYNCIAWAAQDSTHWWEPDPFGLYFWPSRIPREYTLDAYIAAYASIGFEQCESDAYEHDIEKVAIFVNDSGSPTHASRQLESGEWTSKLGQLEDIEHQLDALSGNAYGTVAIYMARGKH